MSRKKDKDRSPHSVHEESGSASGIPGRPWSGLTRGIDSSNPAEPKMSNAGPESSVLVVGPPRSGKTTSVVIPNVLNAPAAVVTTSTKADVLEATAFRRHALGNCFVFDPTGSTAVPPGMFALRWSPVVGCDSFEAAVAMAHALGAAARPGSALTESAHWVERAESLLAPLLFAANLGGRDMATVCRWVLGRNLREPLGALEVLGHEMALVVLRGVLETEDRERSGIFSTASGLLAAYRSEAALATTVNPNFDPVRFARSADTLYICAPAHAQVQLAPLVVALLEQIRSAVYARPKNAAPVVFALDEVASIAPLPSLPAIAAEGGGQGLVTLACLQDLAQARARWGEVADGFFSLFNSKLIFPGIGDYRTLQLISALAGEEKVRTQSVNIPQRILFVRTNQSASVTHSSTWRPRLPIDAVAQGHPGYALCLAGSAFSWLHMVPWFELNYWRTLAHSGRPTYSEPVRPGVPAFPGAPLSES
jgi:type IV secretion system protein VirD4